MNTKTGPIEDKKLKTLEEARSKILPFTMTHMYLRSCNKWTFGILRKVNEIPTENLQLRHIELFFKTEPQQAIMQCDSAEDGRINYLQLLTDLERKNVSISFYFGVKEVRIDMHRELAALRLLSPFEIWHFSGFRRPFSDLDRTASKGRRLSLIGSRLFLRYSASHLQLLNRPTFNPASWAQTAFFQGNKGAKRYQSSNDLRPKARVEDSSSAKDRALGRRNFRRRLAPLLGELQLLHMLLQLTRPQILMLSNSAFVLGRGRCRYRRKPHAWIWYSVFQAWPLYSQKTS